MYKLLLCSRYLRSRYIALASVISVMLGVATMIVVNSVMAGFSTEMKQRIHGILADIVLESVSLDGVPDYEKHQRLINDAVGEHVAAMTPTVEVYGMLSFQYVGQWITRPVTLIGIEPESKSKVGTLTTHLESYQTIKDKSGKVVQPPLRGPEVAPNWELAGQYLDYRQRRMQQKRLFQDEPEDDLSLPPGGPVTNSTQRLPPHNDGGNAEGQATTFADKPQTTPAAPSQDGHAKPLPPGTSAQNNPLPESSPPMDNSNPFDRHAISTPASEHTDPATPLPARVYVGKGLISYLHEDRDSGESNTYNLVQPGDDVKISTVTAGRPPNAVHFNASIVDIFKSGMSEYDSNLVFVNLDYLQQARGMIDPASGQKAITTIQIRLKDYADADKVVKRLRAAFPGNLYQVRTWEQKQGPLLAAVSVETAILNVLLFLIIAVAGFGILAIFFMIVVEKTRDIGILKALGASSAGVQTIFMTYGFGLGIVGSGVGVILGLLFVWKINTIEAWLTWITGIEVFDDKIYYFPEIPTHVEPSMVIWVALGAMAIAVLASVFPARRAAALHPVQALRYE